MVTEFFWLVGIQEMGIPEAINHAIEQLPIGTWFICTKCCGCTVQPSSKTAFTPMLLQNHLVLNCFHDWMLSVLYHNYKLRLLFTFSVFKLKFNLNWNSPASQYSLSFAVSYRLNFITALATCSSSLQSSKIMTVTFRIWVVSKRKRQSVSSNSCFFVFILSQYRFSRRKGREPHAHTFSSNIQGNSSHQKL